MDAAITSFVLGVLSMASPCVLPLYPGFLVYLGARAEAGSASALRRVALGGFVLLGVMSAMLALGLVIASLAIPIGTALAFVVPIADGVVLALGVALILDRNPFRRLPQVRGPALRHPFANAYLYGVLYGPLTLPCSGPLVVAIFAASATLGEATDKLWVFLWFGLGFGLPLFLLAMLSTPLQRRVSTQLAIRGRLISRLGGVLLVGVALYDLRVNWDRLVAFYT